MGKLCEKLKENAKSDIYPLHMPGHKRNVKLEINPYEYDITEVDGFDDLHSPMDILKNLNTRLSRYYGCDEAIAMVNGSTGGILTAISAVAEAGDTVLIARNCHKSVYNALYIRGIKVNYLYPNQNDELGINEDIKAQEVENFLNRDQYKAVVITSPTYEGVISDIDKIADIVHKHEIPLIVDAAHGAHLAETRKMNKADIYVTSLHKTLPALTQTSAICFNYGLVDSNKIKQFFDIYVTSSPSYLLLASIEKCLDIIDNDGTILFKKYNENIMFCREQLKKLKKLYLYEPKCDYDIGKLVICTNHSDINGKQLKNSLLKKYHIQVEMVSNEYVIAMTSIMDSKDGLLRLIEALKEIDEKINSSYKSIRKIKYLNYNDAGCIISCKKSRKMEFNEAIGKKSAEYIYVYPPGIPVVVPGELITADVVDYIRKCILDELDIHGIDNNMIKVIEKE